MENLDSTTPEGINHLFFKSETLQYISKALKSPSSYCEFCMADLRRGYCTMDENHWICDHCFNDL